MSVEPTIPNALELADARLRLRGWQEGDAPALFDAVRESLSSVGRWLPWCHAGYDLADAEARVRHCQTGWQASEHFAFAVFDRSTGELFGSVGLSQRNRKHRSANMGYWVRQSRHGQAVATAAAGLVARFGFEQLGLIRIEIIVLPDNQPSRRTAEKIGARFEAMARQRVWEREQPRDAAVYALIPQDMG